MLNSGLIVESSKYLIREGYWTQTMAIWHAGMQRNSPLIDSRLHGGLLKEFLLIVCKGGDKAAWSMHSLSTQHANSSVRVYLPACKTSPEECCVRSEQGKTSPGFFLIVRTNTQASHKMKSSQCPHNSYIITESIWDPNKRGANCPLLPMCPCSQCQHWTPAWSVLPQNLLALWWTSVTWKSSSSSMDQSTSKSSGSMMDQSCLKVFWFYDGPVLSL